jgi:iron complex outermembrane receptor protein
VLAQSVELDSVTVTASIIPQKEKETGRNILSISGSNIQQLPINSIDELLKYLPGIEVQQRGPQGAQSDIIIRGGTFQQVLVVIDGVRMNEPLTGHFNGNIPLHPADIKQIDIIKGAAAAVYGSDAVGGVINIITHHKDVIKNTALHAGFKWGSFGQKNTNLWLGFNKSKWGLSISAVSNKADGETLRGTTGYFKNEFLTAKFDYVFKNNWKLNLLHITSANDFNAQNFYTTFKSDTAAETVKSSWTKISISKEQHSILFKTDVSFKKLNDFYRFNPTGAFNQNHSNLFLVQSQIVYKINAKHQLATGLQLINKKIVSNDRGNHELAHAGSFIVLTHKFPNNFNVNESIRIDWDQSYGWVVIPQLNSSWVKNQFTVRSSIGRGVRDADFTERYNNYNKQLVTSGSIGNPYLQTEKSWSYELGVDYRISNEFKVGTTLFYRDQKQLIDWIPTNYSLMPRNVNLIPTGNYALANNLSSVQTSGIEVDLVYTKKWSDKKSIRYMSGIIWLNSNDANNTPSFYISSHAKFLWNQQMLLQCGKAQLAINSVYKVRSKQTAAAINAHLSENYFLVNSKFSYLMNNSQSSVFIESLNILDTKYSDLLGANMPGRWFSAGFQIKL